jgi:hypothetical protein
MRIEINSRGTLIFHSLRPRSTVEQSFRRTTKLAQSHNIYQDGLGKRKFITYYFISADCAHREILRIRNHDNRNPGIAGFTYTFSLRTRICGLCTRLKGTVPGIWNRVDVAVDELCFLRAARRTPLHKA